MTDPVTTPESQPSPSPELAAGLNFLSNPQQAPAPTRPPIWQHPNAPYILCAILLLGAAFVMLQAYKPAWLPLGRANVVVFDPVKFMNAQRAAASILATNPSAELSLTMTQVAKQAEAVIKEEAAGALVLVKQAVVGADGYSDITDKVLNRFGLDTKVPTITIKPGTSIAELAPTDSAFGAGQLQEDYRMELQQKAERIKKDVDAAGSQVQVVP